MKLAVRVEEALTMLAHTKLSKMNPTTSSREARKVFLKSILRNFNSFSFSAAFLALAVLFVAFLAVLDF